MKPVKAWAVVHYKTREISEVHFKRKADGKLWWYERWQQVLITEAKPKGKRK